MVYKFFQLFVLAAIMAASLACNALNLGPVGVKDAKLARDPEGSQPTTLFAQDDTFYFLAELVNAPPTTRVKASWTALEVDGMQLNLPVDEAEITSGSGLLQFKLANNELWPAGRYKIDLYLNDQLARSLEFQVEPTAAAALPVDSPTPSPEPSATPTSPPSTAVPDPGITPSPELPAATTVITRAEQSSAGDTLAGETDPGPPLPLEPYAHPSGVFTMLVPQGWRVLNEDATSVRFGNEGATVGSVFADVGAVYDEAEMQEFVGSFAGSFITTFAPDYRVIEQRSWPGGGIYLAASYGSGQGNGNVDFLFTRQEQVVFVLYFVSPAGQNLASTWAAILDGYRVDPAALPAGAAGATVTPPPPPPTATPSPPTSTPAPLTDQFAPPPGRSRLYLVNKYEQDIVFTINNSETRIPAGSETPIDLDAGQYSYSVNFADRSTGGEVSLAPDQSWAILVDAEGNVYYAQQIHP